MHPRSGELFQAGPRDGDITGQLESKPAKNEVLAWRVSPVALGVSHLDWP